MKLTIRNNLGQEFQHTTDVFCGYDVFIEANEHWGNSWETYRVLDQDRVLESVVNPTSIDIENPERIH